MSKPTAQYAEDNESDYELQFEDDAPNNNFVSTDALIVEKLLGRKFVKDDNGNMDELYFIKWKKMSYLHASWERREDIERVDQAGKQKIKRFLLTPQPAGIIEHLPTGEVVTEEVADDCEEVVDDGEEIDYFNPELAEIQRVIACDTPSVSHSLAKCAADLIKPKNGKKRKSSSNSLNNEGSSDPENGIKYLIKWRGQPYDECTWERWEDIKFSHEEVWSFWQLQRSAPKLPLRVSRFPTLQEYQKLQESPLFGLPAPTTVRAAEDGEEGDSSSEVVESGAGLRLRDYQLEGVNWLLWNWWHKRACILADEMGLGECFILFCNVVLSVLIIFCLHPPSTGKTIQTIGFLHQLRRMKTTQIAGPFLIIAPLSLVDQWQSEVAVWSPDMNCVLLHGNTASRELIVENEFYFKEPYVSRADAATLKKAGVCKFNILLTTFEVAIKDIRILSKINWQVCGGTFLLFLVCMC